LESKEFREIPKVIINNIPEWVRFERTHDKLPEIFRFNDYWFKPRKNEIVIGNNQVSCDFIYDFTEKLNHRDMKYVFSAQRIARKIMQTRRRAIHESGINGECFFVSYPIMVPDVNIPCELIKHNGIWCRMLADYIIEYDYFLMRFDIAYFIVARVK
jgi:hypothetical protein